MTQAQGAKMTAAAAAEPIIELVETIPLRYLALAVVGGFVVAFVILYTMSDRIQRAAQIEPEGPTE